MGVGMVVWLIRCRNNFLAFVSVDFLSLTDFGEEESFLQPRDSVSEESLANIFQRNFSKTTCACWKQADRFELFREMSCLVKIPSSLDHWVNLAGPFFGALAICYVRCMTFQQKKNEKLRESTLSLTNSTRHKIRMQLYSGENCKM